MKKFQLRILSVSLIVLLIVTTTGLVAGAWFLKDWEDKVTKKFEGRKWDFASKIYSDSYHIYIGLNLRRDDLVEKLRRLGYYETSGPPKTQGAYHIDAAAGTIDIFHHDFEFPTEKVKGYPVRISLQGSVVSGIENLAAKTEKFDLELEPEVVTGLYQRAFGKSGASSSWRKFHHCSSKPLLRWRMNGFLAMWVSTPSASCARCWSIYAI